MPSISGVIRNLHQGTFKLRIRQELESCGHRARNVWWKRRLASVPYVDARVYGGSRMRLYPSSRLSRTIYCRSFECDESRFVTRFLRHGDIFLDVGAHIGYYTLLAARCVGTSGKVISFEPTPESFEQLRFNVQLNRLNNVVTEQYAVSDREELKEFYQARDSHDAWNAFVRPHSGNDYEVNTVQTITLDGYLSGHVVDRPVTMIKIDVEGWEMRVLEGSANTLEGPEAPVLQVEFTDSAARAVGSSCAELYDRLENIGYRLFRYDRFGNKLVHEPRREYYPYTNLIACKDPNLVAARLGCDQ